MTALAIAINRRHKIHSARYPRGRASLKAWRSKWLTIPPSHADLLGNKQAFAQLATLNPDGSPQVTPVWVDFDGTNILVNTAKGRVKTKNLEREPRVAISITDPENPYRYLGVQGRVIE